MSNPSHPSKTAIEAGIFLLAVAAVLAFQFRAALADGHMIYPMILEDPGGRYSWLPWDYLAARLLHRGEMPLWNDLSGTGMPLLANYQSGLLIPLKWPYFLTRIPRLPDLFVIARLALLAAFTFALARDLGRSRTGAAAAGLGLALCGYLMKHQNMVNVSSEMWLPLLLLLARRERRGHSLTRLLLGGLAFGLVIVGGNPEAAFYVVALDLAFILVIARGRAEAARLALVAFAAPLLLGGLLAAAQSVPFVEYLGPGWHIHDPSLSQVGRHPVGMIGSLIAPWLLGPAGTNQVQLFSAPYVGSAALLLALLGALHPVGHSREGRFFVAVGLVLLGIIYALPGLDLIARVPPLDRFGNVKYAMFGVCLAAALLAGAGVDVVRAGRLQPKISALALAAVSVLLLGGALSARRFGPIMPGGVATPFLAMTLAGGLVFLGLRRGKAAPVPVPRPRLALALVALLTLELALLYYGWRRNTAFPMDMVRAKNPQLPAALEPVAADPGARFTGAGGAIHPCLNLFVGLPDLRSFEAMYPRNYVEAMGRIEGFGLDRAVENFFSHGWMFDVRRENLGAPLLDRMALKYVVSPEPVEAAGFTLVRSGDYRVYRNDEAWPRARVEPTAGDGTFAPAQITSAASGRVEIDAAGPGRLVLADTYFPGWRAEVDGRPVTIAVADGLFRAVDLDAGPHRVSFTYVPAGFRVGWWMSLATLAAMAVTAGQVKGKRSKGKGDA